MNIPQDLLYTKEHEWIKIEGNKGKVGITDYAQSALGDVTFVELPEVGQKVKQFEPFASVESVKSVSDVYAPMSGTVVEANERLEQSPELINQSPYEEGWIATIEIANLAERENLLTPEAYKRYLEEEA